MSNFTARALRYALYAALLWWGTDLIADGVERRERARCVQQQPAKLNQCERALLQCHAQCGVP